ncbi:hypothetical protein [Candidatus Poriferisodalis sp.]|uniref:hypothetical protein n=1 Tax=Candidatus Poriferisodalis sp. TaxID=3101277 RepID=UPI003B019CB6
MSRDEPDASESDDDALDDAMDDPDLLGDDFEPVPDDLEDEELGVADLDDDVDDVDDLDTDGLGDGETASSDDDAGPSREVPAGVRPASDDEDDDEDDEELEADLGEILKERLASEDEDEDDDDDEIGMVTGSRSASKQEDEILCEGCFLLIKPSQFDTRSPEPSCPHCGTPIII